MTGYSLTPRLLILTAICFASIAASAADADQSGKLAGVFHFEVKYDNMVTPMRYYSDGIHMRVELGEKGDPYLIWIRGIEGINGIAALSPLEKNYSIEYDGPIWDLLRGDGSIEKSGQLKEVDLPKGSAATYMGFNCIRYDLNTNGPDTSVWMLENAESLPFLVIRLWKDLADAAPHITKLSQIHNGLPVKVERKKWGNRVFFSLELKSYDPTVPKPAVFRIPEDYYQVASQIRGGRRGQGKSDRD